MSNRKENWVGNRSQVKEVRNKKKKEFSVAFKKPLKISVKRIFKDYPKLSDL